jgi:DNA-binding transcriptional ArsR family regulator
MRTSLDRPDAERVAKIGRAIAAPGRVQLVVLLYIHGPKGQIELRKMLAEWGTELAQPTVSQHVTDLTHAGLVESERSSRTVTHRLTADGKQVAADVLSWREDGK